MKMIGVNFQILLLKKHFLNFIFLNKLFFKNYEDIDIYFIINESTMIIKNIYSLYPDQTISKIYNLYQSLDFKNINIDDLYFTNLKVQNYLESSLDYCFKDLNCSLNQLIYNCKNRLIENKQYPKDSQIVLELSTNKIPSIFSLEINEIISEVLKIIYYKSNDLFVKISIYLQKNNLIINFLSNGFIKYFPQNIKNIISNLNGKFSLINKYNQQIITIEIPC